MSPPIDEKAFTQAPQIIVLFEDIQAKRHIKQYIQAEFQLKKQEYNKIYSQLKSIYQRLSSAVYFIQKVYPTYSTKIYFLVNDTPLNIKSKHELDAFFWYNDV